MERASFSDRDQVFSLYNERRYRQALDVVVQVSKKFPEMRAQTSADTDEEEDSARRERDGEAPHLPDCSESTASMAGWVESEP